MAYSANPVHFDGTNTWLHRGGPLQPPPPTVPSSSTFIQFGIGAIERPVQDKLRESISAADFGALGDNSALRVSQWLTGGSHSRGAANLTELRAMTGIADLELTDTIDWAAITMALAAAGTRPVNLLGIHRTSRSVLITQGGLMGPTGHPTALVPLSNAFNVIHLRPAPNTRIVLKDLKITGGKNGIYGDASAGGYLSFHSVIDNLQLGGNRQVGTSGFFLDGLQAIGVRFNNIRVEAYEHGLRFRGESILNASQLYSCRAATCLNTGMLFENTHASADTPAVLVSGCTVEYNYGPGMKFDGYEATVIGSHFEGNDNDQSGDGPDLLLSSSGEPSPSRVHSRVVCIGSYWSAPRHPQGWRISGSPNGTQTLVLIMPTIRGGVVNDANLALTIIPAGAATVV